MLTSVLMELVSRRYAVCFMAPWLKVSVGSGLCSSCVEVGSQEMILVSGEALALARWG